MPARERARSAASTGAKPKYCGSSALAPRPAMRAIGASPRRSCGAGTPEQHRGGAVVERRGVAGGDGAVVRAERRAQAGETLGRRVGADRLVAGELDTGDRHDEVVVEALGPRCVRESVRPRGELVLALSGHPVPLAQLLGGLTERDRPLRRHPRVDETPAERRRRELEIAHGIGLLGLRHDPGRSRHGLDAADEHDVGVARLDLPRRDDRCVEARAAEAVDRRARDARRQAGEQGRHPRDVAVLLAGAVRVAEDDLLDETRVGGEAGGPVDDRAHDERPEVIGPDRGESAPEAAERGADGVVDERVVHGRDLLSERTAHSRRTPGACRGVTLVGPVGLEPTTGGLKVRCSTD